MEFMAKRREEERREQIHRDDAHTHRCRGYFVRVAQMALFGVGVRGQLYIIVGNNTVVAIGDAHLMFVAQYGGQINASTPAIYWIVCCTRIRSLRGALRLLQIANFLFTSKEAIIKYK